MLNILIDAPPMRGKKQWTETEWLVGSDKWIDKSGHAPINILCEATYGDNK